MCWELVLHTAPLILLGWKNSHSQCIEPSQFNSSALHENKHQSSISPLKLDTFPQNRTSNSPSTTLVIVNIAIMFPVVMQPSLAVINAGDFQLLVAAGGVMSICVPIMTLQGICTGRRFNTGRQKWTALHTISFPVIVPHFSLKALQLRVSGWKAVQSPPLDL